MINNLIKTILFLILFYFSNSAYAISVYCKFEEVYQNHETQTGKILINNDYLRYEYDSTKLYTIIKNPRGVFSISNLNHELISRVGDNKIINHLVDIYKKYPNINKIYKKDGYTFKIEKSKLNNFVKRISIKSSQLNMSIFFIDCDFKKIQKFYFNEESIIDYM